MLRDIFKTHHNRTNVLNCALYLFELCFPFPRDNFFLLNISENRGWPYKKKKQRENREGKKRLNYNVFIYLLRKIVYGKKFLLGSE